MDCSFAKTIVDFLDIQVQNRSDELLYEFIHDSTVQSETLTFGEFYNRVEIVASNLSNQGLRVGDRAILIYPPGIELIISYFACLFIGVIAIPVYPPMNIKLAKKLYYVVKDSNPKIILSTLRLKQQIALFFNKLPDVFTNPIALLYSKMPDYLQSSMGNVITHLLSSNVYFTDEYDTLVSYTRPVITENDLAFLQYTSGSTSKPKGVKLSHLNVVSNVKLISEIARNLKSQVCWLPPYHDMGLITGVITPVFTAIPVRLFSPLHFLHKPLDWLTLISKLEKVGTVAPNFAYDYCVKKITAEQREELDLREWKRASCGAEPVRMQTMERFYQTFKSCGVKKEILSPCYGLAEATLFVSVNVDFVKKPYVEVLKEDLLQNKLTFKDDNDEQDDTKYKKIVNTGKLYQEVIIVDVDTMEKLPEDNIGEIWVHSDSVSQGYWNKPQDTENIFNATVANSSRKKYLRTGDLGFIHENNLYVTARIKDLIIVRGKNYYPQDIESAVEDAHIHVRKNSLVAIALEENNCEKLVIVCETEKIFEQKEYEKLAQKICKSIAKEFNLAVYNIVFIPPKSLPKTTSGKVQRQLTKQLLYNKDLKINYLWQSQKKYLYDK